jgi:predicted dehydrogenase
MSLKVGIVGAPRGGGFMAGFNAVTETKVVAVCDTNRETLERVEERHGIERRTTDFQQMLDSDLDIIVVSTPMPLHAPMAVAALNAGKHVLSEVTAATDLTQCWQLAQAVKTSGKKYMMAENYCYMKPNVLVKELARRGLFGTLYFGEGEYIHDVKDLNQRTPWRRVWQTGRNGCTYPTHSLGPVLQWFNAARGDGQEVIKVECVSCFGSGRHYKDWRGVEFDHDDLTLMLCQLNNGSLVKIRLDMLSDRPHNLTYYSLQGTKGCYEATRGLGDQPKIWLANFHPKMEWHSLWELEEEFIPAMWRNPPEEAVRAGHGGGDYFEVRDFVDSILNDTQPPIDVFTALDFTVPGLVSEESIERGGAPLPVPDFRTMQKFPDDLPEELKGSRIVEVNLPLEPLIV